jgi:hypothetical protein
LDAVVVADAYETPGPDEVRTSAGARSEPLALPHP